MLLLQYSRQAAYVQCKIISIIEASHCDCEKILDEKEHSIKTHNSLPASVIKASMPDECFVNNTGLLLTKNDIGLQQKPYSIIKKFSPQSFAKEWIQPPRC